MFDTKCTFLCSLNGAVKASKSTLFTPPPPRDEKLSFSAGFSDILGSFFGETNASFYAYFSHFQEKVSAGYSDHIHSCALPFLGVCFSMGAVCLDHIHFRALLKTEAFKRLLWVVPKILCASPYSNGFGVFNDKFINRKGI